MTFIDLISLISLLLSVASFATSSVGKFAPYKREFMAVGYVLFGFVISRIIYTYLPPGNVSMSIQPRTIVWAAVLALMAVVVLVALKREGSHQAVWTVFLFMIYLGLYGKSVGLVDTFKLRDNEILEVVGLNEKVTDYDRAIELLEWMKNDHSKEEQQKLDMRIGILKTRKAEKLTQPQGEADPRHQGTSR